MSARAHLKSAYPELQVFFDGLGPVRRPAPRRLSLPEAVVRIVVGQMLSGKAADSIQRRIEGRTRSLGLERTCQLPDAELRECGLSARKIRTIREFARAYEYDPASFERWRKMNYEDLADQVRSFWGLSNWTAEMLAIFYFGHPDVFPTADGSINRAVALIQARFLPEGLDPGLASPYRSTLAAYLWTSLDRGYWDNTV